MEQKAEDRGQREIACCNLQHSRTPVYCEISEMDAVLCPLCFCPLSSGSSMNLISTLAGSMMEGFFPRGWDLAKIDRLADATPESLANREKWWNAGFEPVVCRTVED